MWRERVEMPLSILESSGVAMGLIQQNSEGASVKCSQRLRPDRCLWLNPVPWWCIDSDSLLAAYGEGMQSVMDLVYSLWQMLWLSSAPLVSVFVGLCENLYT